MVSAIEKGYPQREIAACAYRFQRQLEAGERVMVGVNNYAEGEERDATSRCSGSTRRCSGPRWRTWRGEGVARRGGVTACLAAVREAAKRKPGEAGSNLMPPIIEAAKAYCTEQEICDVLREVLGTYTDPAEF